MSAPKEIRLAELVACLALASNIGMGQPIRPGSGSHLGTPDPTQGGR